MSSNKLKSEIFDTHFELTLNRPEKRNALDADLMIELTETILELGQKVKDQKYLIFKGEGSVFCAGADINWMKSMADFSFEENVEDSEKLYNLFFALYSFRLPVICLVQGAAFGGAIGLLAASDYVFIEKGTKLCFSEVKLGLSPAVISTFVINRTAHPKAKALMLSGQIFDENTAIAPKGHLPLKGQFKVFVGFIGDQIPKNTGLIQGIAIQHSILYFPSR